MKYRKSIVLLSLCIIVLSAAASITGIFSGDGPGKHVFTSIYGEQITVYGKGLYRFDSVSMAAQAVAQDIVTLCLGIPLLAFSVIWAGKNSLKGRLLLTGTLAYFLYTYMSYTFTSMYNTFFLVDTALMSMSFFAFVLTMMSYDIKSLPQALGEKFPAKPIAVFLIFLGTVIGLMWLGRIVPSLLGTGAPAGLEHYTTLVIQGLDLGFMVPISWLTGILLLRKNPFGLLLGAVVCIKGATMLTALTAMIIGQIRAGAAVTAAECIVFPAFNLIAIGFLFALLGNVKEPVREVAKE